MAERVCEVCGVDPEPSEGGSHAKLERLLIEERVIALCPQHRAWIEAAQVKSLEELFALLRAQDELRSAMDRRSPLDRRVFPPRPEGRRRGSGRRSQD